MVYQSEQTCKNGSAVSYVRPSVSATGQDRLWLGGLCLLSHPLSHILRLYDFTSYVNVELTLSSPCKLTVTGVRGGGDRGSLIANLYTSGSF
jgi:hypothetical protein